jgi:uracil-DNA glycosylase family 4
MHDDVELPRTTRQRSLPLYAGPAVLPVEEAEPLSVDHGCRRCELGERPRVRVCLAPEGEPGGLLVVGEAPGADENAAGRPFVGQGGKLLRAHVAKHWTGPVAYGYAVGCFAGREGPSEKNVDACRGYLAQLVREVKPQRVLALGGWAAYALTGRSLPMLSVRKGYTHLASGAPVFFVIHPTAAARNRFVGRWFAQDLEWALTAPVPERAPTDGRVLLVEDEASALAAESHLREAAADGRWFAFDCETMGQMHTDQFRVVALSACAQGEANSWTWTNAGLDDPRVAAPLRRLLADPTIGKAGQSVKYDALSCRSDPRIAVQVQGVEVDTLLLRKLQFSDAEGDLETIAELVGMGGHKAEAQQALAKVTRRLNSKKSSVVPDWVEAEGRSEAWLAAWSAVQLGDNTKRWAYGFLPFEVLVRYCSRDTVSTARAGALLEAQLRAEPDLWRSWRGQVLPAALAAEQMEAWGIHCDYGAVKHAQQVLGDRLKELESQFGEFKVSSPKVVAEYLYGKLKLPVLKRTAGGGDSTDSDTLEAIKGLHPVVPAIIDWRRASQLWKLYAKPFEGHIRPDGRIHPSIKVHGARTSRFSCAEPNLFNIPRAKLEDGKLIRDCFTAPPGFAILEGDYSQIELRVAAAVSGDPEMIAIFKEGVDYHLKTAQMVSKQAWGKEPSTITEDSEERSIAKVINFSLVFGEGDAALAAQIGCTVKEAARVREAILGRFKVFAKWTKQQIANARRTGETWVHWQGQPARRRSLWQIEDHDGEKRSNAERGSYNSPVQGEAAQFGIASIVALVDWIRREGIERDVKLVLTVYDSIMLEVREDLVPDVARKVRGVMEGWRLTGPGGDVPLVADFKKGYAWGSLRAYKP